MEARRIDALERVNVLFMAQIDLECSNAGQTDHEALITVQKIASLSSAFTFEYAVVRESDGRLGLSRDPRLRSVAAVPSEKGKKRKPAEKAQWIQRKKPFDFPPPLEERPAKAPKICKGKKKQ